MTTLPMPVPESESPTYSDHPGFRYLSAIPLRVTPSEWAAIIAVDWGLGKVIHHPRFTLWHSVDWCGNDWDYCEVFEICLLYALRPVRFGPHKTRGLAARKALAYLVETRAIELLPERHKEQQP